MAKKKRAARSPEQVAARGKPGWHVFKPQPGSDVKKAPIQVDETTPELAVLRKKFLGDKFRSIETPADKAKEEPSVIVPMTTARQSDTPSGKKAVVVKKEKIIGEQG